jgi:hypothetical protein
LTSYLGIKLNQENRELVEERLFGCGWISGSGYGLLYLIKRIKRQHW